VGSYEGIAAVVNDFDRVESIIGLPAAEELERMLRRFAESDDGGRDEIASLINRFMQAALPLTDAVYAEFSLKRLGPAGEARGPAVFATRLRFGLPIATSPKERILRAELTSAFALRDRGADPELPDLIRLHRADGSMSLPDFQFDELDRPREVVLSVNRVLDAEHDPWAVADWWLSRNVWLGDSPAKLLGSVADDKLLAAAAVAVEG
jgi:hypothetical protein